MDKYGLNNSGTSSTGLVGMDDFVNKLVDDDCFAKGTDITQEDSTSDVFSFDGYVWRIGNPCRYIIMI